MLQSKKLHNDNFMVHIVSDGDSAEVRVYPLIPFNGRLIAPELVSYGVNYGAYMLKNHGLDMEDVVDICERKLKHESTSVRGTDVLHYVWDDKVIYTVYVNEDHFDIIATDENENDTVFRFEVEELDYYSKLYNGHMKNIEHDGKYIKEKNIDVFCI